MSALVTFHVEPWHSFKTESRRLWDLHWQEIALNKDSIELAIDFEQYARLDAAGQLLVMVARSAGAIVGYWLGIIHPHLHYVTSLTAQTDVYYLLPEVRKGRTGIRLFEAVEAELSRRGVQRILTATKKHADMSPIFRRMGYTEVETVFAKVIRK